MKALPQAFTERMLKQLGPAVFSAFEESLNTTTPVSIRINPKKINIQLPLERVKWCDTGFYLPERPVFVADPLWHAGAYYVQEASSMALEQAFRHIRKDHNGQLSVLDLCAAPGGKSTHIASLLTEEDVLVSNEVIRTRVGVLNENLTKWGYPNTIITNSDPKDFENCGELFDVIVVDAPCSGEGLFRKDAMAIDEWSTANTTLCTLRQKRILEHIVQCLKPGGFLIYSTCTYNPEENELQIAALINQGYTAIPFDFNGNNNSMHQCYPHEIKGEGFFIALLQKGPDATIEEKKQNGNSLKPLKDTAAFRAYINKDLPFFSFKNNTIALAEHVLEVYEQLGPAIQCYSLGTKVCEKNDKLLIPSEFLPFSDLFNPQAFEIKNTGYEETLQYLGKQALPNRSDQKGYVALQYKGINIGFGKLAGNRINNLFPNEWRLRKSIKPEEYFSLLQIEI